MDWKELNDTPIGKIMLGNGFFAPNKPNKLFRKKLVYLK
jgi:hypothetical protein